MSNTTNNIAEYTGLLLGLEKAHELDIKILYVKGDSMLVIKQMKNEFNVNSPLLKQYHKQAKLLEKQIGTVFYEHIYREYTKRADELANNALRGHPTRPPGCTRMVGANLREAHAKTPFKVIWLSFSKAYKGKNS